MSEKVAKLDNQTIETIDNIPTVLPVLPLRDVVLYPYMIFPVLVGRESSLKAANEALEVELSDVQGINLTGVAGHGITLAIDEEWDNALDVTELFEYDLDHSDRGRLSVYLSKIPPGEHLISIKAWDSQNNPNVASVRLTFFGADDFRIFDLFNYPNPMVNDTEVTYMLSHAAALHFTVYSLAGRKLFDEAMGYKLQGFNSFPWSGRDQFGNRLANGVYIIVLEARSGEFDEAAQILQKVVIAR